MCFSRAKISAEQELDTHTKYGVHSWETIIHTNKGNQIIFVLNHSRNFGNVILILSTCIKQTVANKLIEATTRCNAECQDLSFHNPFCDFRCI